MGKYILAAIAFFLVWLFSSIIFGIIIGLIMEEPVVDLFDTSNIPGTVGSILGLIAGAHSAWRTFKLRKN
jgi:multisubunit Na+/H+ antiporter MnhE subunit